jgi:Protein of unknown function (DUF1194)
MRPGCVPLIAAVAWLLALVASPAARAEPVDLALVLAIDISRSIDEVEAALQRQGYIAALTNPKIVAAIQSGAVGAIALSYVEWAGADYQRIVVPWTVIHGADDAGRVAAALAAAPHDSVSWTSISGAIDFSRRLLESSPHESSRRVIDVSGDGRNNSGRPAELARDAAVAAGITINGLPILNDRPNFGRPPEADLDQYYEANVIGGPGAFMIVATDFNAFGAAILSKLIKEIADGPPANRIATAP